MDNKLRQGGIFLLLLGLVVWSQQRSGSYHDEFGAHPDEAAHFVSALMIRDYFVQLAYGGENKVTHPKRYAENYYDHYPKVAIGNWPPGFHCLQALWMLAFKPGQHSIMALMAVLTAGLGWLVYKGSRENLGEGWAIAAAVLLVVLPIVQKYSSLVMTEVLMGLLVFGSVLLFTKYLETGNWKWSLWFGAAASAAILVKGSGLVLGLVPPLAIVFLKRWDLLKKPGFWLSAVVVGILCFPWYHFTKDIAMDGWAENEPSVSFFLHALAYNSKKLVETGGPLFLLCIAWAVATFWRGRKGGESQEPIPAFLPMMGILFMAVPLLHCIVPAGMEHRHLIPMLPAYVVLASYGMKDLVGWIVKEKPGISSKKVSWVLSGIGLAGMFASAEEPVYHKGYSGFRQVVEELYKVEDWPGPVLISSDASGEGMFVAEAALADPGRPNARKVVRATKALGSSQWSGKSYETAYCCMDDLRQQLVDAKYWAIVIDGAVKEQRPDNYDKFQHIQDLEKICQELGYAERFTIRRGNKDYEGDLMLYLSPRFADFSELDTVPATQEPPSKD